MCERNKNCLLQTCVNLCLFMIFVLGICFVPVVSYGLNTTDVTVNTSTCSSSHFRCDDGQCIPARWRCDSHADCNDGSDEPLDCGASEGCSDDQFQCELTKHCIPMGWRCDGEVDCGRADHIGEDTSDEDPLKCGHVNPCPVNQARCGETIECRPLKLFCDNHRDCPDGSDEWDHCQNKSQCDLLNCEFGCRTTPAGPMCFCQDGQQPNGSTCVDFDECQIDGVCEQTCHNLPGSYNCSCVAGYTKRNSSCIALNVPPDEEASLIFTTQNEIRRTSLSGQQLQGNTALKVLNSHALDFLHRQRIVCYIHNNVTKSSLVCAEADNLSHRRTLPAPAMFSSLESIHQLAIDWISGNWYFLDDTREMIFACDPTLKFCTIILEVDLSKPRGLALDPTSGFMFVTKWGHSPPTLDRCLLDGSNRTTLVNQKIVYPYGITLDFPKKHVYWVDTYLNSVERINYDGSNKKTIKWAANLFWVSVFERSLFFSSWKNNSIIKMDKYKLEDNHIVKDIGRPYVMHVFHRQRQPDVVHPCGSNNGGCSHLCIPAWKNTIPIARCACRLGFRLKPHGKCIVAKQSAFLMFGKDKPAMIKGISMSEKSKHQEVMVPITDLGKPRSIDYHVKSQYIYYSDVQRYLIERQKLESTEREIVIDNGINNCEGIAIDWLSNNIYFTDEGLNQITVAKMSNVKQRKILIQDNNMHPRAIVVDPKKGYMYWSDWSTGALQTEVGRIQKAWMDGTHQFIFVQENIIWPSGLTIDYMEKHLYWCDAKLSRIERISLDGTGRELLLKGPLLKHPYGLAYYDNFLFWTEFANGTVQRYHLGNKTLNILTVENPPLLDVKVFDNMTQTGTNECSNETYCPELCIPTPERPICLCRDGHSLNALGTTCIQQKNYTTKPRCAPGQFQCVKNHNCIDLRHVCDGDQDCGDGSDEDNSKGGVCENATCLSDQFRCDSTRCINQYWVCDGDKDCDDGTDEDPVYCHNITCTSKQFTCKITGRCIPLAWTCDSDHDCGMGDISDEHADCKYPECDPTEFVCENKHCIPFEYYCDGDDDCKDNSDERGCQEMCPPKQIYCAADSTCLPHTDKCDGEIDCSDGSDEAKCNNGKHNPEKTKTRNGTRKKYPTACEVHEFTCSNRECIRKEYYCDGISDCLDGSDEVNCTDIDYKHKNASVSGKNSTATLQCEHPSRWCDGNLKCIPVEWLCDGKTQCMDGSDEGLRCNEKLCDHSNICSHTCHNTPEGLICSCPKHLHLQADGKTCSDAHPCESWGTCSQKCIPLNQHHKCACNPGYLLQGDGFTCKSTDESSPLVIFSNRHELRGVDLKTYQVKALIASLKNTIALDFWHKNNTNIVFWTDVIDDKIYRGTLIGASLSNIEVVVQTGLATAEGLAVDWIGENLYWVESNLDQIEVSRLNGNFRRTLVAGDMESPRAIALDPRYGYMFWSDWDSTAPRIERCTMAGYDRTVIVKVDQLTDGAWPNGLTLDYDLKRVYWIDARSDSIHTTTYDGQDHHEVMRDRETLSHPFAIALFENHVYWTDWRTNSVIRANKWNGSDVSIIQRTLTQPFDIQILHPSRQPRDVENPCGIDNGGCSHLCLLNGNNTYKCDCPHVMRLMKDEKNCIVNEQVLLFSRPNEIRGVDLMQPNYHTIPTISIPQVIQPVQIEFVAAKAALYWSDTQVNEVKSAGLTRGPTKTILDTGIENPVGFAIDWISNNMFVASGNLNSTISVYNLDGEYGTIILQENLDSIRGLALDPIRGHLFWVRQKDSSYFIEFSTMDGNNRKALTTQVEDQLLVNPQSLSVDLEDQRLYWVDMEIGLIQYYDFQSNLVKDVALDDKSQPITVTVYKNLLYYADQKDNAIHKCDKTTGGDREIVRNNTGNILSIRIYDRAVQTGNNTCSVNKGGCEHLCLPISAKEHVCKCATGYKADINDSKKCIGIEEFIFYSMNWEIKGLPINSNYTEAVLGSISRVSMASNIDFHGESDHLYWADNDHGTITRIRRDGTERQVVIEQHESLDNIPVDWMSGLAIDWIAGNMYWADPKRNVIEVSRLNGSARYVVVPNALSKLSTMVIDPQMGLLFFSGAGTIQRTALDGSNQIDLINNTKGSISGLTLDYDRHKLYWCDSINDVIMRMDYDGRNAEMLLNHSITNPIALAFLNDKLYWVDTTHDRGSIKSAPITNLSDYTTLLGSSGDSLKDIKIFSKLRQSGTNPCGLNNGGCEVLCLFNGTHPVCACPHGNVAADGKSCEDYDSFLMYSRVVLIDSIHVTDETDLNSPYPTIKNRDLVRNVIGLAYDYSRSRLFYSDIQKGSINSVYFNGTNHTTIIDKQGSVEGLAYEQLTNTLYWTCNNVATISQMELNQTGVAEPIVKHVVRLKQNDKPRGIAVDGCQMLVFWTNWNSQQPSIQRAFTTGFHPESIITTDIRMPNAITLDHKATKLYWGDARLDKIERTDYDGSNRMVIVHSTPQHPFALAIYNEYIFWSDWVLHAVIRCNKYTGEEVTFLRKDLPRPMGIVAVYGEGLNCQANPCSILNGGCEHKCFLNEYGSVYCTCSAGYKLGADSKRCVKAEVKQCEPSKFQCTEGECIPMSLTCDGIEHCRDASDEDSNYCALRMCPENFFQCGNRRCILSELMCDGQDHCGDGTDETNCSCTDSTHFRCKNGVCISSKHRCDRDPDCSDASDEMGCPPVDCGDAALHESLMLVGGGRAISAILNSTISSSSSSSLRQQAVQCPHTTACYHPNWLCDGENDCWDFWDEQNCTEGHLTTTSCGPDRFRCTNGRCISIEWKCDDEDDCGDAGPDGVSSDEKNCEHRCRSDQFRCSNSECIPAKWQCDGMPDCLDGSDESKHCAHRTCAEWEFRCNSTGSCIPWSWVCDGEVDCADGADEYMSQGCHNRPNVTCLPDQFQCLSMECIDQKYYCDKNIDCRDGSDEPKQCISVKSQLNISRCHSSEFMCKNQKCILVGFKCNGYNDCGDNSDEESSLCKEELPPCKGEELFECPNGVCINSTLLCNGENDCGDFGDEITCNINECEATPPICAQECIDIKIGYECRCGEGFNVSSSDRHLCSDINECLDRPCSQHCRNTHGSYVCSCGPGYSLKADHHTCKAISTVEARLIFSNRYYIREVDLAGHNTILVHNLTNVVALDFDWQTKCIVWSDVTTLGSTIHKLCPSENGIENGTPQLLHSSTLQNPDGLAVDWVARNLYWCDKGSDTIEVSKLDGKYRKVLIKSGLQEPRAIALDPHTGYMYWTDWGDFPHIGKAGMDGSNQRIIVNDSLGWPNALTINFETQELFWADAREDYIAVSDFEGNNKKIIVSRAQEPTLRLHHVFALAVWEDYVYWTDWETKSIERCHKYRGNQCKNITTLVHRPMDLRIYHPYRQITPSDDKCSKANCSTLCLLTPEEPGYKCACPEGFLLASDGKACKANCTGAHFVCADTYKCIPFWWKCDTQDDCGDGSDEPVTCPNFVCHPGQFQCTNNHCIHPSQLCDGNDHCGDGSDEKECDKYTCLSTQFKCKGNGTIPDKCISIKKQCDGVPDCLLADDEDNCQAKTCLPTQFTCKNGRCIPPVWVCDGDNDCSDGSDEEMDCQKRSCPTDSFRCHTGRCIPQSWRCDGDADCIGGEDEPESCSSPDHHTCEPTYFKCSNNKCIPGRWRCDYENDCGDNSDETGCQPRNCSESEFRCKNGICVRGSHRCDGAYNCEDHSDEIGCNTTCSANEFQCHNPPFCIYKMWQCDGDTDCADGSDEINCKDSCLSNQFTCRNDQCISLSWRCDGQDDCGDGSDEDASLCADLACEPGKFRCMNHKCVETHKICDGVDHCGDGTDETNDVCASKKVCHPHEFRCVNGHCVSLKLQCDGNNDCLDNSDEEYCAKPPCLFGTCSQICLEKKAGNYACKCSHGYEMGEQGKNATCQALGKPAFLLVASDADLRIINPYKAGEDSHNQLLEKTNNAPNYKLESIDILWGKPISYIFWTDHHMKKIQKLKMKSNISSTDRVTRSSESIQTVLDTGLQYPNGIAVDWINKMLYWTDFMHDSISVCDLDGKKKRTLIDKSLQFPKDIIVDPYLRIMVWSTLGRNPNIELSSMDGDKRKMLVNSKVYWPTGLALDYPAKRLYWADAKGQTIESIAISGIDRKIIHRFTREEMPNKLEVFEDFVYVSTFTSYNILRINKFGHGDISYLARGLNRISDILLVQEHKQQNNNVINPCNQYTCHQSAMCLLSSLGLERTCVCPDGLIEQIVNTEVQCKPGRNAVICNLKCNTGVCQLHDNVPKCLCPSQYDGEFCQHYKCSQYCHNKGFCYFDLMSNGQNSPPIPKCNCPPEWTGERCEIPTDACRDHCSNGGTCYVSAMFLPKCNCPPGFTGDKCEQCTNLQCQNAGICSTDGTGQSICKCPQGYSGTYCQKSDCDDHCRNQGQCILTSNGPLCRCQSGYTGKRCEQDACKYHCLNNGICHPSLKQMTCECPDRYAGRRCEIDLCNQDPGKSFCSNGTAMDNCADRSPCLNGGVCEVIHNQALCRCTETYGGANCEIYFGHQHPCENHCENKGICTLKTLDSIPHCSCVDGWHGSTCEIPDDCENYCLNGATCQYPRDNDYMPICVCKDGYTGARCASIATEYAADDDSHVETGQIIAGVAIGVTVVLLVVGMVCAAFYVIQRRRTHIPFSHSRLHNDNLEITNPIYLEDLGEETSEREQTFPATTDKVNFANPVYETMYSTGDSDSVRLMPGSEEKKGLLNHQQDDTSTT